MKCENDISFMIIKHIQNFFEKIVLRKDIKKFSGERTMRILMKKMVLRKYIVEKVLRIAFKKILCDRIWRILRKFMEKKS